MRLNKIICKIKGLIQDFEKGILSAKRLRIHVHFSLFLEFGGFLTPRTPRNYSDLF